MSKPGMTRGMGEVDTIEGRDFVAAPFGKALAALGGERDEIVGLTADLGKYTDILPFRDAFPDRYFNIGMAEQNLVAVAAGLAKTGRVPYITTYGVFATRRAYDFIAIGCAHSNLNVNIFAAMPGLTTGYGGTHQAIEDAALAMAIPNLTVIDPCDATEIMQVTRAAIDIPGTVYVRLQRGNIPVVLDPDDYRYDVRHARVLRRGRDVGVVSTGLSTGNVLDAVEELAGAGIEAGVLHMPTLKPFDETTLVDFARAVPHVVTVENHVSGTGLASLVANVMVDHRLDRPLTRIGLPDQFIECGSVPYLMEKYGISSGQIARRIQTSLSGR